jgi:hypothetical protein
MVTKRRIYSSDIKSVITYGAESWIINKDIHRKLLAIEIGFWWRGIRKILRSPE